MAKSLSKMLAVGAIAGATLFGGQKADADIAPLITTTIHADQDYDLSRPGKQIKYEWAVYNRFPPAEDIDKDSIKKYTILSDLESKGMYDFKDGYGGWDFTGGVSNSYETADDYYFLYPGDTLSFSALVDEDSIIGNEFVQSYATSFSGQNSPMSDIQVPVIPEPTTLGLAGLAGAGLIAARKIFRI